MNKEKLKELFSGEESASELAKNIGINRAYSYNFKNGDFNSVGSDILEKIAKYFRKPVGYFFDEEKDDTTKYNTEQENRAVKIPEQSLEGIPLIPIDAMAGVGKGEFQIMEYECERYVVPMFRGAEFLIQVKGSSMIPKYNSGDVVACKKLPLNDIFFQWNKVYVLDTVQGALVKRIKKGSDNDHILIVSDNEQYEAFELHKNQINGVALVIGVIRLE
jgi:phage repressor protein C with HTH and peptisase S24 domain